MHVIEVRDGELLATIEAEAAKAGIADAAIVTLIGAVDSFTVSTMPVADATKDVITDYGQPARDDGHRGDRRRQAAHPHRDGSGR